MNRIRAVLFVGAFALCPSPAFAQLDVLWEWAERLSGPGPWDGLSVDARVLCFRQDLTITPETAGEFGLHWGCLKKAALQGGGELKETDSDQPIRSYVSIRAGKWWSKDGALRFPDAPAAPFNDRKVNLLKIEPMLTVRVSPVLDIGTGVGVVRFWGEGFTSFNRGVATPISVLVTPLAAGNPYSKWTRIFKLRFESNYLFNNFDGSDFGASAAVFQSDADWVQTLGLVFDLGVFWQ